MLKDMKKECGIEAVRALFKLANDGHYRGQPNELARARLMRSHYADYFLKTRDDGPL